MARHLHLRPFARFDAEVLLGSLVHLGAPAGELGGWLAVALPGSTLAVERPESGGVRARAEGPPGAARDAANRLPPRARARAEAALGRLPGQGLPAGAEPLESLLACCLALDLLEAESFSCEPLPLGAAPLSPASGAALAAAGGLTVRGLEGARATLGPLGVALLAALAPSRGPAPRLVVEGWGLGLDHLGLPSLEALLGRPEPGHPEELLVLAANLDDLSGELLGTLVGECLGAGALDAWLVPVLMKKGRPGHVLEALCRPAEASAVEERMFRCSSTLGVRRGGVARTVLERTWEDAHTRWGPVRVKLGWLEGRVVNRAPEFEDCRRVAEAAGVPLKEVYAEALSAVARL